ncbi:MAG: hypothetical protein L0Z53_22730 [Acidobacteriales bacterium]|nr:hypothetical protein [Terriglobales bacterium]
MKDRGADRSKDSLNALSEIGILESDRKTVGNIAGGGNLQVAAGFGGNRIQLRRDDIERQSGLGGDIRYCNPPAKVTNRLQDLLFLFGGHE